MRVELTEGATVTELQATARALGGDSRSYCPPYALVAFHDGPVGVDIERVVGCDPRRLEGPRDGVDGDWRAWALPLPDGYRGWVCWR